MSSPARQGKPWMDEEVQQLLQAIKRKESIEKIAAAHQRTTGGITARLRQLAADYYFNDNRPIEEIMRFTGLDKDIISDAISRRQWQMDLKEKKQKQSIQSSVVDASPPNEIKREYMTSVLVEIRDMMREMLELMKAERAHK